MKKVRVLRLSGCRHCKELLEELDSKSISYESFDADEHDKLADEVEDFTGIISYPIVIITSKSSIPTFYLYKASSTEEIGESIIGGAVKIGHLTTTSLVDNLINLLK